MKRAFVWLLFATVSWSGAGPGALADGDVLTLADFDAETVVRVDGGSREFFELPGGGRALRFSGDARKEGRRSLFLRLSPVDLRPFGVLRFRLRRPVAPDLALFVRLRSGKGGIALAVPACGAEWTPVEIPIPSMWSDGEFDPSAVIWVEIGGGAGPAFVFEVDDVVLVRTEGGWRGVGDGREGFRYSVADFEGERPAYECAEGCRAEVVAGDGGRVLRLTESGNLGCIFVVLGNLPRDLRRFRWLTFRARAVDGSATGLRVTIDGASGEIETTLPKLTEKWCELRLALPDFLADETFDARKAADLRLFTLYPIARSIEIDDVALVVGGAGWRYTALELLDRGMNPVAPVLEVADFEAEGALDRLTLREGRGERVANRRDRANPSAFAFRWTVTEKSHLYFRDVPRDFRDYRILRFLARAERDTDADIQVRVESRTASAIAPGTGDAGSLATDVAGFTRRWKLYEIPLPTMHRLGDFRPDRVVDLHFSRDGPLTLWFDQVELVKGGGGCLRTEAEEKARLFGSEHAASVRDFTTEHLRVWTDVDEPERKLAHRLESAFGSIRGRLRLGDPVGPIGVVILADRDAYRRPLYREGRTVKEVEAAAGYARAGTFVTWEQDYGTGRFRAALARAIVQRTLGSGGGAWLQDGLSLAAGDGTDAGAARVRYRDQVRPGARVGLADLLTRPRLAGDGPGDPPLAAETFVTWLLSRPATAAALPRLALIDPRAPGYLTAVESVLGARIADLEAGWTAWLDAG